MTPGGPSVWMTYRSMTRDRSALRHEIAPGTFQRIMGYARPHRRLIVAFLVVVVVSAQLVVATPLIFQRIVDDGITEGDGTLVTMLALLVAGIAVADAGLGLLERWLSARIGEGLILALRTETFDHLQRQPVAFFTRAQTGALVSRLNSDVVGAQQAFTTTMAGVVSNSISLVVVVVAMLYLSWQVTLLALVLVPLFIVPARLVGRHLAQLTREQMSLNAAMSTTMTERFNVAGALLVKLFGRLDAETEAFSHRAERVADIGVRIAMSNRIFFASLTLVAALATAITYGVGGNLVIDGALTIGTLLALVALLTRLYGPLTALSNVRVDIMTALVSFERVFEVLDLEPLVSDAPHARPLPPGPSDIELREVSFRYPLASEVSLASLESVATPSRGTGELVLRAVSLRVEPGQLVALVGPSGAGKTTISALLARLYDPTSGQVLIGGMDLRDATLSSLQQRVGVVTQEAHMFHDTIRANLRYAAPSATDEQVWSALRAAQVADVVHALPDGLDTVVGDRGYRLSGGEKQRLAVARLLLKAPEIVVLDEATAHLDSDSEAALQRALDAALAGRTAVVIAHRLSTVRGADQILVVDKGEIVERGDHVSLLAAGGLYADLYRTQFLEPGQGERSNPPSTGINEPVT
jgi:ATP-binding cassette subfamily B protein